MEKVRFFLGITLIIISVVAAAATKARTSEIEVYFYDNSVVPQCIGELTEDPLCEIRVGSCIDAHGHELYAVRDGQFSCSSKLGHH